MQGEDRLCLLRSEFGIFPLLLSSLSPSGATLEFKRTVDGVHLQPGQRVALSGVDNRLDHLLREIPGQVVWFDMSYVGVAFDSELAAADLEALRRDLGA